MTPLEERLRDELRDLAQRLAPGDLRPLRRPPARNRTSRLRWLAPVAAATAVASVATGLVLARSASSHQRPRPPGALAPVSPAADPPLVAIAGGSGRQQSHWIKLVSPATGKVVKTLSVPGVVNAYALSPDGARVFVSEYNGGQAVISGISVSTGKATFIADGYAPAISPDGRYLAYSPAGRLTSIAIRDLRTGSTRSVDLSKAVGASFMLIGLRALLWLGDGTALVVAPSPAVQAGGNGTFNGPRCASQLTPRGLCLVVVDIEPHKLSARRVYIPRRWSAYWTSNCADLSSRHSIYIFRTGPIRPRAAVRITFTEHGVVGRRATTMPQQALPLSMAPGGDRLLYLAGRPPHRDLWIGTVRDGRLVGKHVLVPDGGKFAFYSANW